MQPTSDKVVLVTGAEHALGERASCALAQAGHTVYAGVRDPSGSDRAAVHSLCVHAREQEVRLRSLELDVLEEDSVAHAVRSVLMESGRIDALVHLAGGVDLGAAETFTLEELRAEIELHVIGIARTNRAVLPHMRARRSGLLVHLGAPDAGPGLPFLGVHDALRATVEGLAAAYRRELVEFDIDSVVLAPHASVLELLPNGLGPRADFERVPAYGALAERTQATLERIERDCRAQDPQGLFAQTLVDLVGRDPPRPFRTLPHEPCSEGAATTRGARI